MIHRLRGRMGLGVGLGLLACTAAPAEPPAWWAVTPQGNPRISLIGHSLAAVAQAEAAPPYFRDSLGLAFRYMPPEGGTLWVEYWVNALGKVQTLTLTWEHPEFAQLARLYQTLRRRFEWQHGPPQGPIGNQTWYLSDSLHLRLHLSPERRYLQLTCWQSRTFEP